VLRATGAVVDSRRGSVAVGLSIQRRQNIRLNEAWHDVTTGESHLSPGPVSSDGSGYDMEYSFVSSSALQH
jgi:hypothetical protein